MLPPSRHTRSPVRQSETWVQDQIPLYSLPKITYEYSHLSSLLAASNVSKRPSDKSGCKVGYQPPLGLKKIGESDSLAFSLSLIDFREVVQ